jgi:hypothetical protein
MWEFAETKAWENIVCQINRPVIESVGTKIYVERENLIRSSVSDAILRWKPKDGDSSVDVVYLLMTFRHHDWLFFFLTRGVPAGFALTILWMSSAKASLMF